ncbi:mechanosensitive ion channel family protein [Acetivibrio cellulolyticus]|uniref:mechanosensitive ion channel family protein n=1 Tax=Acetivibrio cellulolyticus TaxID=35830 RepID=UPI0001E2EB7D|nr:mechanosensitive ion channel family protein [Acetivibrio cellulolyticus]
MSEDNKKNVIKTISLILKIMIYAVVVGFIILGVFAEKIFGPDNVFTANIGSIFAIKTNLANKLPVILKSITYIILIYAGQKIVRMIFNLILKKSKKGVTVIKLLDSFIKYACGIAVVFVVLSAFGVDTGTLLAGAGILGLAVGLGAQSLIEDIIAGLFLVFEKTFNVGDIVVIGGFRGTVKEIGIRTIKIVDIGGDTKIINNSKAGDIINMTNHLSLAVCDVEIEYGESLERVESILSENLQSIGSRIEGIVEGPFYKGIGTLGANGVGLKIIANCRELDKFQITRDLNREIKLLFDEHNISIPFQHIVVNDNTVFQKVTEKEKEKALNFVRAQKALSKHMEDGMN